jgi:multiple sugar transport system substrate-binding protein
VAKPWLNAVAVIVAAGLIAWGPEKSQTVLHNGRTPVIFWHMWKEKEWQDVVEGIVKRFNESQSEYQVIPLAIPPDDAVTKFLLAETGGDPPDLVSQWMPVLDVWTDRGLIEPVENEMTPAERTKFLAEAYPIIQRHSVYKNKIMAMTIGVDIHAIYYRLDDLKEVGRDEDHLPKTLEELTNLAHQLDRKNPDGTLKRVGFLPQNFEQLAPSFGQTFPDASNLTLKCKANSDAAEYIYSQDKRVGFENVTRFLSSQPADVGIDAPMLTGNYSMILDGQWRVKQMATFAPDLNYTVAPIPPPDGGRPNASYTNADLLIIPKGSKQARGAWEFIKFWIGFDKPEVGAVNTADMAWLPYCAKVAQCAAYQAYLKKYPRFRAFLNMMGSPNLAIPPQGPLASYISDQMQQMNDGLNRGSFTPEQAIDSLQSAIDAETVRQRRLGHG